MNILFVCTGNTCRSPMAEGIINTLVDDLDIVATSAGIMARDGENISENSYLVMKDMGVDLGSHRAKILDQATLDKQDLIITMSNSHKDMIMDNFHTKGNIYTLYEYVDGESKDISDPYGMSYEVYIKTRDEIKKGIIKMIEKIKELQAGKIVGIGSDHGGYPLKEEIKSLLEELEIKYIDYGTNTEESVDYPEYGRRVANAVVSGEVNSGIVICGTGIGISIAANKVKGIRCALCSDTYSARMSKNHNNANMLSLGARVLGIDLAKEITKAWLSEEFEGGRHERRVNDIEK